MSFEYVQIRYAGEQYRAFVSEPELIGRSIVTITNGQIHSDMKMARAKLSRLASSPFELLADIHMVHNTILPFESGEREKRVWPTIRFRLDEVRFVISCLIEDADRLGHRFHQLGQLAHRTSKLPPCPPCDIDRSIQWIIEQEIFRYQPDHVGGPELWGTPAEMHQTLTRVLHDNINYQLSVYQGSGDSDEEGGESLFS